MAISRGNSLLMKKQWAEDGSTVIPNPPVAGTTYRDESVDEANIAEGQKYDGVADSARWNQLLYIMTGILKDTLAHGVLPWINTQDYAEGAVVIGSNGTLYIAKIANGPTTTNVKDPTTDATADTWKTVLAISSVGEGLQIESNKLKLSPYKGATASEAGKLGGVPPAAKEDKDKFLKGDGTWAESANAGSVIIFAANATPAGGFLLCNGAAVSRTTYAALFAAIGTTYGSGDGSTTFNLPNLTNKFIQGSGTAGTVKSAGLPNITGVFSAFSTSSEARSPLLTNANGAFESTGQYDVPNAITLTTLYHGANNYSFSAKNSNTIYGASKTVQPPAVTMRYYIKY